MRVGLLGTTLAAVLASGAAVVPAAAADSTLPSAELVTVTQHGFAATWTTAARSDTTVCVGTSPAPLQCERQEEATKFHYARVGGLKPGTHYSYVLQSAGTPEPVSQTNPGMLRTLDRPPGRHLFNFAVVSDTHVGEDCSGTAATASGESIPPCFSNDQPPYAARMLSDAVHRINHRSVDFVIDTADVTSNASHAQTVDAKAILDRLDAKWHIARGNHDVADKNPPDPRCGTDNDCLRAVFFPHRAPGRIYYSFDHRGYHFVVLDSNDANGQGDLTDEAQNRFLLNDLEAAKKSGKKTFVVFHHPVSEIATTYAVPPFVFGVRADKGGEQFLEEMADFPNVVGVLNSHTHRNFVSYSPWSGPRLPFVESGPTKEYPAGYSIFKVYTGGYQRNFVRLGCRFCRHWTYTTRGEYLGLYPLYTLGTLSARNFVHVYHCPVPTPPQSLPGEADVFNEMPTELCPSG